MTDIVSKQGKMNNSEAEVFAFLTDLRNLENYIPTGKIHDWEAGEDWCSFSIPQIGSMTLRITDKQEFKLIKVEPDGGGSPFSFRFYVQMKEVGDRDTRIVMTLRAELNAMMRTMFKAQLKKGLDKIIDTLSDFNIPSKPE
jgi:carbon monoxide dehydrogenase subunit G